MEIEIKRNYQRMFVDLKKLYRPTKTFSYKLFFILNF
jgi:hypothetical protein